MIKFTATTPHGNLVVFGLSHENLDRLRDGQPIKVDMTELGGEGEVVIYAGETEETMVAQLADLIGPDTVVHRKKQ